jgi:hypothetical protein
VPDREGTEEARANKGSSAFEPGCPGDSGSVVTPGSCVFVFKSVNDLFQNKVVEEQSRHFQIVYSEVTGGVTGRFQSFTDIRRPLNAPKNWM